MGFGFSDIHKCRFVDHLDAMQRGLLVNHVLMRKEKRWFRVGWLSCFGISLLTFL